MTTRLKRGLSGWLGRQTRSDQWHRMYDGGDETLCGIRGPFGAGPTMNDTFRHPERQRVNRCPKCEKLYADLPGAKRRRR